MSKAQLDAQAGTIALDLHEAFARVEELKYYLDAKSTGDLQALGYTSDEANLLKSAYADLDQLRTIYQGLASLANAKDFRTFARQVFGLGQVIS